MSKVPRGKRLEEAMEAIRRAAAAGDDAVLRPLLSKALRSGSGLLAKQAATLAGDRGISGLREDLELALAQFLNHPEEDRGCLAKEAVARLLLSEEEVPDELWEAAARHVQQEPTFGGSVDTAADLRGIAAMGVAGARLPHKVHLLIDLLLDPEIAARAGAVRALGAIGSEEALSLVRYKTLAGDDAAPVTAECFRALLLPENINDSGIRLVTGFLARQRDELAEEAALALGESRHLRALPVLAEALERTVNPALRATLLRAVALLRHEEAFCFLAKWLEEATPRVQAEARAALAPFRGETALAGLFR